MTLRSHAAARRGQERDWFGRERYRGFSGSEAA
jgi:hypothetical protein